MLLTVLYEKICELIFSYLKKLVARRKTWGKKRKSYNVEVQYVHTGSHCLLVMKITQKTGA